MPQFAYRAKRDVATEARGVIEAQDLSGAILALKSQGLFPLDVQPVAAPSRPSTIQPVPVASASGRLTTALGPVAARRALATPLVALWARTLAQGLHGGLSLTQALQLLVEQEGGRPLGRVARQLHDLVVEGQPLSYGMLADGRFSPVTVALVQAGEASGSLEQALDRIAVSADRQAELAGKVRAALAYPTLILAAGCVTTLVLITVVVPRLATLFTELGQTLPWPTRVMLGMRGSVGWVVVVLALGILAARLAAGRANSLMWVIEALRRVVNRLPVLGPLVHKAELAGWCGTLGLMIGQGVPLPEATRLTNRTLGDPQLRQQLARLETDVPEGISLSESLRKAQVAAPLLITMTAIGESEGALDRSLMGVAATFERDVDQGIKVVSSLLEPLLILAVGLVVAAVVFSMLLPIFQINFTVG